MRYMWLEIILFIAVLVIVFLICQLRSVITGGSTIAPSAHTKEYERWLAVQDMTRIFGASYEGLNILERWLVACSQNQASLILGDPILNSNPTADTTFIRECGEKKISNPQNRLDQIHKIRDRFLAGGYARYVPDKKPRVALDTKVANINYGRFAVAISLPRFKKLEELGGTNAVITAALRYGCLLQRGQQWSIPSIVYESLDDNTVEGFASPFNSQNVMLGRPFCSLFPDTDKPFGSLGPFFEAKFTSGQTLVVNPPFIPDLMAAASRRCVDLASNGVSILFIGPNWIDAEFIDQLSAAPGLFVNLTLGPGSYYYQDASGKFITAKFSTRVFAIGPENPLLKKVPDLWRGTATP